MSAELMTRETLMALTPATVMSVYSGAAHKCMCGCKGIHRYNSKHTVDASRLRGYKVTTDEVNDRMVKKALRIVQSAWLCEFGEGYISTLIGEREYVIYPV